VLGRFTDEQRRRIDPAIGRAVDAIVTWTESGIHAAMNRFNAGADDPDSGRGDGESKHKETPGQNDL
jgi:hypothetical protein